MGQKPLASSASQIRRSKQLDALAAVLPMAAADRYAEVLTDADVATLKHLADTGMGANTLRALASDLAYLEAWSLAATERPLPWPAEPELVLKFIAHHLWDPDQKVADPAHGMPEDLIQQLSDRKILKVRGPHAPKTVSRRLSNWSTLHQWKGVEPPFDHPGIRKALRLAMKASARESQRKSRKPVTRDVLDQLLQRVAAQGPSTSATGPSSSLHSPLVDAGEVRSLPYATPRSVRPSQSSCGPPIRPLQQCPAFVSPSDARKPRRLGKVLSCLLQDERLPHSTDGCTSQKLRPELSSVKSAKTVLSETHP
jgi:hypothetical protein